MYGARQEMQMKYLQLFLRTLLKKKVCKCFCHDKKPPKAKIYDGYNSQISTDEFGTLELGI